MHNLILLSALALLALPAVAAGVKAEPNWADIVQDQELKDARQWLDQRLAFLQQPTSNSQVQAVKQGWGSLQWGWSVNHFVFNLNGRNFTSGFGSHADSEIRITPPSPATHLAGRCGIDSTEDTRKVVRPVTFSIEADGKEIWHSDKPVTVSDEPLAFDVAVRDASIIILKAHAVDRSDYTPVDWVDLHLIRADGTIETPGQRREFGSDGCFSFLYDGKPSSAFLHDWKLTAQTLPETNGIITHRLIRTDPATGLQCTLELKRYTRFPVIEWTLRFKNTGNSDTPIIERIRSMDLVLEADQGMLLHYNTGDHNAADGFEPHVIALTPDTFKKFAPIGGRPTSYAWPYYNLEYPTQDRGAIVAVSWPGQWSSSFAWAQDGSLHVAAGQELTHLRLHPGEEVRTPLSLLLLYRGNAVRAQNLWRRWMIECNLPRPNGKLPAPIHAMCQELRQNEKREIEGIELYQNNDARLTHWWLDAGWYPCNVWSETGTWEPDPDRFPHGVKAVSEHAHSRGLQMIVWFEPERVHPASWLAKNRPQWLLPMDATQDQIVNLGNAEARTWITDRIDALLTEQHVDIYRQDFNTDPLSAWRRNDSPDRQGITEIRHVEGYLAFWDELHRRHPGMPFDTCASGGRRMDLETLRRSVPFLRSDYQFDNESNQAQTIGLASWVPFFGSGIVCKDAYTARSNMLQVFTIACDTAQGQSGWDLYRREIGNWGRIVDDSMGDFYALLPHSLDQQAWMAWQYNRPDTCTGTVQVFRRSASPFTTAKFPLHGLDGSAQYALTDLDNPDHPSTQTGQQLMDKGLEVHIPNPHAAVIVHYEKR